MPTCAAADGCALAWEQAASDKLASLSSSATGLAGFLRGVPKGADLHNHLSGAVDAETYLDWAKVDGNCINSTTFAAVFKRQCSATNLPVPGPGAFHDDIVRAWSMKDFVTGGAISGHDHFFATLGTFGLIAGAHRDDSLADVARRAADEKLLHVETMFNMGKNIGQLTTDIRARTLTEADLPGLAPRPSPSRTPCPRSRTTGAASRRTGWAAASPRCRSPTPAPSRRGGAAATTPSRCSRGGDGFASSA